MTTALQQQAFALDARFNAHRAPNNPNFSKGISYNIYREIITLYDFDIRNIIHTPT